MTRLSTIDAFFAAYQEQTGVDMQLSVEVTLDREIDRDSLLAMLAYVVDRWPPLASRLERRLFGLAWGPRFPIVDMFRTSPAGDDWTNWRKRPLDPFREPPFQLLWVTGKPQALIFRAHHAVVDGEAFCRVCLAALDFLGGAAPVPNVAQSCALTWKRLYRRGRLLSQWRYLRWLKREARMGRSAVLAKNDEVPGPTACCRRIMGPAEWFSFKTRTAKLGIDPLWFSAAAWLRTIHDHNLAVQEGQNPLMSVEFPVSLRRGGRRGRGRDAMGNCLSPLTLFGDAGLPTHQLAQHLKHTFRDAIRQGHHRSVPLFTLSAAWLPWFVFKRLAIKPTTTGFATSHFTWLQPPNSDTYRLDFQVRRLATPVCLHMGAALSVLIFQGQAQLFITFRPNALTGIEIERMADQLMAELDSPVKTPG